MRILIGGLDRCGVRFAAGSCARSADEEAKSVISAAAATPRVTKEKNREDCILAP